MSSSSSKNDITSDNNTKFDCFTSLFSNDYLDIEPLLSHNLSNSSIYWSNLNGNYTRYNAHKMSPRVRFPLNQNEGSHLENSTESDLGTDTNTNTPPQPLKTYRATKSNRSNQRMIQRSSLSKLDNHTTMITENYKGSKSSSSSKYLSFILIYTEQPQNGQLWSLLCNSYCRWTWSCRLVNYFYLWSSKSKVFNQHPFPSGMFFKWTIIFSTKEQHKYHVWNQNNCINPQLVCSLVLF